MITDAYLRMMSRYNGWQNAELFAAAERLSDDQRREDRGAFWGSIHGTLSHIYWADRIWLSRFGAAERPEALGRESGSFVPDWSELRVELDDRMVQWADAFPIGPIEGEMQWFSGVLQRDTQAPLAVILTHIFNHQTHHRGQAHALITAQGERTADTDLFLMPPELWPQAGRAGQAGQAAG